MPSVALARLQHASRHTHMRPRAHLRSPRLGGFGMMSSQLCRTTPCRCGTAAASSTDVSVACERIARLIVVVFAAREAKRLLRGTHNGHVKNRIVFQNIPLLAAKLRRKLFRTLL